MSAVYESVRILLCQSRTLSYGSAGFFLRQIEGALRELGIAVDYFVLEEDGSNLQEAEKLCTVSYDAVLDINSYLPRLLCDDDMPFIGKLQGPFYHYLVDHPMHVRPLLSLASDLQHVICLDTTHQDYLARYFPYIPSSHALPLAGSAGTAEIQKKYRVRKQSLLFPATYMPLEQYLESLQELDSTLPALAETLGKRSLSGEVLDLNDILAGKEYPEEACRYMDRYIRELRRQTVLEETLRQGIPLTLCGEHWQHAPFAADAQEILPPCGYAAMLAHMGEYAAVLNVQPLFPVAPHDRIFNGMRNGALVLTDSCLQLEKAFQEGVDYIAYSFGTLRSDIERFANLWKDIGRRRTIARSGLKKASKQVTWRQWCEQFLTEILQHNGMN